MEQLDADACVKLLRSRGVVEANDAVLRRLVEDHGRHALTVGLIGGYIGEFCGGAVAGLKSLGEIDLSDLDVRIRPRLKALIAQERRFARVAERYRESLAEHEPATLALLERLCLFRLGIDAATLTSIFTGDAEQIQQVAGPALAALTPDDVQTTLERLTAMKLVEASSLTLRVCEFFNSPAAGWNKHSAVPAIRMVIDMSSAGTALRSFQPTENSQPLRVEHSDDQPPSAT